MHIFTEFTKEQDELIRTHVEKIGMKNFQTIKTNEDFQLISTAAFDLTQTRGVTNPILKCLKFVQIDQLDDDLTTEQMQWLHKLSKGG